MKGFVLKSHEAQALVAGKPVVIWRVCRSQPLEGESIAIMGSKLYVGRLRDSENAFRELHNPFPLGVPLFGKETWGIGTRPCPERGYWHGAEYKADLPLIDSIEDLPMYALDMYPGDDLGEYCGGWKSSTTMPEWASRIILTLSDVKVRRPCDVTEEDAKAMGFTETLWMEKEHGMQIQKCKTADDKFETWFRLKYGKENENLYHFTALATPQSKDS